MATDIAFHRSSKEISLFESNDIKHPDNDIWKSPVHHLYFPMNDADSVNGGDQTMDDFEFAEVLPACVE